MHVHKKTSGTRDKLGVSTVAVPSSRRSLMGLDGRKAWVALSLTLALLANASPAGAKAVRPDVSSQVQAMLARGDRAGALRALEKASPATRLTAAQWGLFGDLRYDAGRRDAAQAAWTQASKLAPAESQWHERIARTAIEDGQWSLAATATERLVALSGSPQRANDYLGVLSELHTLAGDFTRAEQAARALMRRSPSSPEGALALAYVHLQADEDDAAEAVYLDVLEVHPDNEVALNNLGNIEYMRLDFEAAQSRYEHIVRSPDVTPTGRSIALANLAEIFQIRGDSVSAESLYGDAIEARPDGPWGYMGLAATLDVLGEYDGALDTMAEGWTRDQNALSRLNTRFYKPEWAWQRDALIAEVEGELEVAAALWTHVLRGDVTALRASAAWHMRALAAAQR